MMNQFVPFLMSHFSRGILLAIIVICLNPNITWAQETASKPASPTEKKEKAVNPAKKTENSAPEATTDNQNLSTTSETASNTTPLDLQKPPDPVATPPALEPSTNTVTPGQIQPVDLSPAALHQEMDLLKKLLKTEGGAAAENESVIVGEALKAPSRYHLYLSKAADISQELLSVREELLTDGGKMSLQQLGALAQDFSLQYDNFRKQLSPSEQKFQSAILIETAVKSLNEAIDYWRTSNHYRRWGHGGYTDKIDDNQILQLKLQTANTAIGNLSGIVKTRQLFSRSFDIDSN